MTKRQWALVGITMLLGIVIGLLVGLTIGQPSLQEARKQRAATSAKLRSANDALMSLMVARELAVAAEPHTPVVEPGVYFARIIKFDRDANEFTFEWLGSSAPGEQALDEFSTPQRMKPDVFGSFMVQEPYPQGDVTSVPLEARTLPRHADAEAFFASLSAGEPTGERFLDAAWWVYVTGPNSFFLIQQQPRLQDESS